jgi:prepilin-type N-terminal cleavage/methylation domain-containing protein
MRGKKGFTLIELMVVILIVGILAAVAVPLMRGRINRAKWSEANASCGTIWTSVRAYIAEKGPAYTGYAADIQGAVSSGSVAKNLGFNPTDLEGTYFTTANYVISGVVAEPPACVITVTPSKGNAPPGSGVFTSGTAEPFVITGI